jgi:hypothetical protein
MTAALGLLAGWFAVACLAGPIVGRVIRRRGGRS